MEWEQPSTLEPEPRRLSPLMRGLIVGIQRGAAWGTRHWLAIINGFFGLLLIGSLVAPTMMALGWAGPARVAYTVYSFTCHQLPERSYFLFGPNGPLATYNKAEVVAAGADPTSLLTLREFVGAPELGWKLGFSDRMVSMYGGAFLGGIVYALLARRGRVKPIPVWLLVLMIIPMALDGTTHMISDVISERGGVGFRDTNVWAMPLLGAQPADFYTGTAIGSLNSILRLVTGLLFGLGMMLFAYPLIGYGFNDVAEQAAYTLARNEARLAEGREA